MKNIVDVKNLPAAPYLPLAEFSRRAAAEGCVLLKNEMGTLPLSEGDSFSLFGRGQIDYYKSGTGSGGMVNVDYVVNILDGILENPKLKINRALADVYKKWALENPLVRNHPWEAPVNFFEMPLDDTIVSCAREVSDTAVIVIGRTAGEAGDTTASKGKWYLSDEEEALLEIVSRHFDKTAVLLNVGAVMDMSWVEKYNVKSVMYIWQGGQEGGRAVADLLCGRVAPSGKLTDTIAKDISLYPAVKNFGNETDNFYEEDIFVGYRYFETFAKEDVLYPFGFGLSYTDFEKKVVLAECDREKIRLDVKVENVGGFNGREVIQVYFEAPQGKLGKSARELCAFAKTKELRPKESEILRLEFNICDMASYDDGGDTGNKSCYVLEKGDYNVYVGSSVRCAEKVFVYTIDELTVTKKLSEVMAPVQDLDVMHPVFENGKYTVSYKKASKRSVDYDAVIKNELPAEITPTGDKGILLADVKNGKSTIEEFVAQLSDEDLSHMMSGEGMQCPKIRAGSVGAVGGLTPRLNKLGVPIVSQHDGPSGIRMDSGEHATSIPSGTLLASSWDESLCEELYELVSIEMCPFEVDCILGPGINIHRCVFCGRNFEYLSEDPLLTGKIAAAMVRGVAAYGNSATIKHFAANNQENNRHLINAVVSERALREIYLKGFEIAVREGGVTSVMTAYNPINTIWSANNYELNTVVLRNEWGFRGFVMTDWYPTLHKDEKTNPCKNLKNMVEAQNDTYMCARDVLTFNNNILSSLENGTLHRSQLQRNAMNILNFIMNSRAMQRFIDRGGRLVESLADDLDALETIKEYGEIKSGEDVYYVFPFTGKSLFCIDYSCEDNELLQMVMNITINNLSAGCLSVNGTNGKTVRVYCDVATTERRSHIKITYPDQRMKLEKLEIKVLKNEERNAGIFPEDQLYTDVTL